MARVGLASLLSAVLAPASTCAVTLGSEQDRADACACLNWKDVYATAQARCGEFAEFGSQTHGERNLAMQRLDQLWLEKRGMMQEFCPDYLERLNNNYCVNVNDWDVSQGAFCYVSAECQDLRGGMKLTDKVDAHGKHIKREISAKMCDSERDTLMRHQTPPQLWEITKQHNIKNFGLVALHSYDKIMPPGGPLWPMVESNWVNGDFDHLPHQVQKSIREKVPVLLYTGGDFHSHYKIVWGEQLISLDADDKKCPVLHHCYNLGPSFKSGR